MKKKSWSIMSWSMKKLHHFPTQPPGIWTFEDWFIQIPTSSGKNCVQMLHPAFFCKRQNQRWWLSTHWPNFKTWTFWTISSEPFACKTELITFKTSIITYITIVFCNKDLTLPVQIPHPSQARFKLPTPSERMMVQLPWFAHKLGGKVNLWLNPPITTL